VETTVRDAYQKDYDVIVPAEAAGALDRKAHDASLWMIDRFFGKVLPVRDVVELLRGGTLEIDFRDGWLEHRP
jgi:ureidoacrylate peracid hydrolase